MNHSQVLGEQQQKGRHQGSRQLLASSTFYGFSSLFLSVCLLHALLYGQACLCINFPIPVFMGLLPIITLSLAFVLHDLWAQSSTVPHSLVLSEYQFWKYSRRRGLTQFYSDSSVFLRRHGPMDKITSQIVGWVWEMEILDNSVFPGIVCSFGYLPFHPYHQSFSVYWIISIGQQSLS